MATDVTARLQDVFQKPSHWLNKRAQLHHINIFVMVNPILNSVWRQHVPKFWSATCVTIEHGLAPLFQSFSVRAVQALTKPDGAPHINEQHLFDRMLQSLLCCVCSPLLPVAICLSRTWVFVSPVVRLYLYSRRM